MRATRPIAIEWPTARNWCGTSQGSLRRNRPLGGWIYSTAPVSPMGRFCRSQTSSRIPKSATGAWWWRWTTPRLVGSSKPEFLSSSQKRRVRCGHRRPPWDNTLTRSSRKWVCPTRRLRFCVRPALSEGGTDPQKSLCSRVLVRLQRLIPPLLAENREFRRFWAGQIISLFGDQVTLLALPLVGVLLLRADARQMGYLLAGGLVPNLLFALHAGSWVDRNGRRRQVMIASD